MLVLRRNKKISKNNIFSSIYNEGGDKVFYPVLTMKKSNPMQKSKKKQGKVFLSEKMPNYLYMYISGRP
jgi:hypothetical protein